MTDIETASAIASGVSCFAVPCQNCPLSKNNGGIECTSPRSKNKRNAIAWLASRGLDASGKPIAATAPTWTDSFGNPLKAGDEVLVTDGGLEVLRGNVAGLKRKFIRYDHSKRLFYAYVPDGTRECEWNYCLRADAVPNDKPAKSASPTPSDIGPYGREVKFSAFESGKWYRWVGPEKQALFGGMESILDGKPHLCVVGDGRKATFGDDEPKGFWNYTVDTMRELPDYEDSVERMSNFLKEPAFIGSSLNTAKLNSKAYASIRSEPKSSSSRLKDLNSRL